MRSASLICISFSRGDAGFVLALLQLLLILLLLLLLIMISESTMMISVVVDISVHRCAAVDLIDEKATLSS